MHIPKLAVHKYKIKDRKRNVASLLAQVAPSRGAFPEFRLICRTKACGASSRTWEYSHWYKDIISGIICYVERIKSHFSLIHKLDIVPDRCNFTCQCDIMPLPTLV
jgi:hypothetical protein